MSAVGGGDDFFEPAAYEEVAKAKVRMLSRASVTIDFFIMRLDLHRKKRAATLD